MKTLKFLSVTLVFFTCNKTFSQSNLLNANIPQEIGLLNDAQLSANDEEPLAYGFVDDRDVLWSKTVWELIDLKERINFPYYYPGIDLGPQRRSLFSVILSGIKSGEITEVYDDGYFTNKKLVNELQLYVDIESDGYAEAANSGTYTEEELQQEFIDRVFVTPEKIVQYRIKGTWYFNKRLGELRYRLLGICPVIKPLQKIEGADPNEIIPLFWVWYPDARELLNKHTIFNKRNSAQPISFDVMLNSRRFSSIIYKEENEYEDRTIEEYISKDALRQMLESERIKSVIRDFEQDMWNN